MDAGLNLGALDEAATGPALICDEGEFSHRDLARERRRLADTLRAMGTRQALLHAEPTLASYAALLALSDLVIPTVLVPAEPSAAVLRLADEVVGADIAICAGHLSPRSPGVTEKQLLAAGSVVMITSGTTGQPKVVRHSWSTLARAVRVRKELRGAVWLLTYP